ncbi:hypothetical protein LCGC14_0667220 [marine sediment metagenome]|uniref:3'-phosphate/5'-hydroxy nucleic acid ligase n=1 Tax=marine sediment metagenome TaxID=412755 RepID=A0A0F9QRZ5_9ZZZZ
MKIFEGAKVPIKSWCNNPEQGAVDQAYNLSSLPFIFKQVCLMPDTHQGYGMPIGGVIACKDVVIVNAVGVDIGCGMIAVKTTCKEISQREIKKIFGGSQEFKGGIRSAVPTGFNHGEKKECELFDNAPDNKIVQAQLESAKKQLGTLGGGNHFIEIQKGSDGFIWLMVHSGSRNVGYKIAKHYNKLAQDLCTRWYSNIPPMKGEDGLAFLPISSKEAQEYLVAMNFALDFAYQNRLKMIKEITRCFNEVIPCEFSAPINIHHNYAALENHFGKNVWVHRKGATSAKLGEYGLIPGSQGTASYVVIGKGNPESFMSCSHGAGRTMSRTKARNELDLETEIKKLDDKNIIHSIRTKKDLDEASSAYKDIAVVMEEQKDLVDIHVRLEPLAVIKA